jgi:hypothetical protein
MCCVDDRTLSAVQAICSRPTSVRVDGFASFRTQLSDYRLPLSTPASLMPARVAPAIGRSVLSIHGLSIAVLEHYRFKLNRHSRESGNPGPPFRRVPLDLRFRGVDGNVSISSDRVLEQDSNM